MKTILLVLCLIGSSSFALSPKQYCATTTGCEVLDWSVVPIPGVTGNGLSTFNSQCTVKYCKNSTFRFFTIPCSITPGNIVFTVGLTGNSPRLSNFSPRLRV